MREYVQAAGADAFFDKSFELEALVDYCAANFPTATPHSAYPTAPPREA